MLHGQTRYNIRSRFFEELPEAVLKWLTPKLEAGSRWGNRAGMGDNAGWGRDWFGRSNRNDAPHGNARFNESPQSLPAYANQQRAAESGFTVGQSVFHTKFGEGTITALEGGGADAKAQVTFKRHGAKWLALAVAKLQAVE
jgi:DNA helicase-2/ATP-dependent DNA helicase PcrA